MQGPHYSTLSCLTTLRTWYPIDVAYWRTTDIRALSHSYAMLVVNCRPLADCIHEIPVIPQSFKSLRENGIQMLQADKQKISRIAHIIIIINKHYSHIIHTVPHPLSYMMHSSRLLTAHSEHTELKLVSLFGINQEYGTQSAQVPAK
jgi:hypothetical protein